jgi:hypothetical protein
VAARTVPAGVRLLEILFRLAATGIAEFFRGRAGFPVADPGFVFIMLLAAGAGVLIDASPPCCWFAGYWFCHGITLVCYYNYSYAHKSFKLLHPDITLPAASPVTKRLIPFSPDISP